jgi:hypothetical protein
MKLPSTRHIEFLEKELNEVKVGHFAHVEDLKTQMRDDIVRLQNMHQAELDRALSENKRLQDACERLTLRLGLPSTIAELPEEPKAPIDPDGPPVFSGSSFQRVVQRDEWMRSDAGKRWMAKTFASVTTQTGEAKTAIAAKET